MPTYVPPELHVLKCELAAEVLRSTGQMRMQVTGWSMLPTIFPGDTLLFESIRGGRVDGSHVNLDHINLDHINVDKGDIVLFHRDRRLFVHRIANKAAGSHGLQIVTEGDGMARPDPPLSASELLGKVSFIVRDGHLVEPAKSLSFSGRAVAALVRRSSSAARAVVGIHNLCRSSQRTQVVGTQEPDLCQS